MKALFIGSRSASFLLDAAADYFAPQPVSLTLNGKALREETRSVFSAAGLFPDTDYTLTARAADGGEETLSFRTASETCSLDVRRFGAKGDGVTDDTPALQAAILACPDGGRVRIPAGCWRTGPLFLKSRITLELQKGAELALLTDRSRFPILPGRTEAACPGGEVILSTWEGNPLDGFAGAINGIGVEDVRIVGEGVVDGRAQEGDWWIDPKKPRGAFRGNLLYLKDCRDVTVQGLTFRNSPSWNLHPVWSDRLTFLNITVEAPADSPNTDGFDPESCADVKLYGADFSVGDDCIAIKSGKIYMGRKYRRPSERIDIGWCRMRRGHGGVTLGSELAGGIREVTVHHCLMQGNDRGLRVKTRRGRGRDAVVDGIRFEHVTMERVKAPLVVNSLYFCDPDGHTPYVQSRAALPVDDRTPEIGRIAFEDVHARDCEACAAYILGLPERPVREVALRDCRFTFAPDAAPMVPAMADGVEPCLREGIVAQNVEKLITERVIIEQ